MIATAHNTGKNSNKTLVAKAGATSYSDQLDHELLEQYLPLVRVAVNRISRNLPSHIDAEDLHSVGLIGLISAIQKYDTAQMKTFEAYALLRIRGAILDELRRMDYMPRSARAKARRLKEAVAKLEQEHGRAPSEQEIRKELELSSDDYQKMRRQTQTISVVSLDAPMQTDEPEGRNLHESVPDENFILSLTRLENEELREILLEKIAELPERQRKILAMYYHEEMRLAEIAEVFGVTEARICQIHAQTVATLRRQVESARNR